MASKKGKLNVKLQITSHPYLLDQQSRNILLAVIFLIMFNGMCITLVCAVAEKGSKMQKVISETLYENKIQAISVG